VTASRLPDGFRVRVRDDIRRAGRGDILVGGTPLRALRLNRGAAATVKDGAIEVHDEVSRMVANRLLEADLAVPEFSERDECEPADLTVVIPVRDRAAALDRALQSLGSTSQRIVVDDASIDPDAVAAVVARHGAQLVTLEVNQGPAGARNAGLARVTTPLVAFVDSDVTAEPQVLLRLAAHFADPLVALAAPLVKGHSLSDVPRWFERYDETSSSLDLGGKPAAVRPGGAVAWLPSACLVGRTEVLTAVGGFDADMRLGEDVDLVWRLAGRGWRIRYDPDLMVRHQTLPTMWAWLRRKYDYGTGGAALAERHGNLVAPAVLSPTYAAAAIAMLAQRRWSVAVVLAAVGHAAWTLNRRLPEDPARLALALQLSGQGLGWTARQETALLLRHWWPAAMVACIFSGRARRAVALAAVADVALHHPRHKEEIGLLPYAILRRLDDLAYGAGLWAGALRHRSSRVLRPRRQ
jgi:mycofactocin system glycosyltransferase